MALNHWRRRPNSFVEQVLGVTPEPWQEEAMRLWVQYNRVAIRSGHGIGKTALLAWMILLDMMTLFPLKIAVTAPTAGQLHDGLWPELSTWWREMRVFRDAFTWQSDRFYLNAAPEMSFAVAKTASKDRPEAIQGIRAQNVRIFVEEASGVPDEIFEAGRGSMSQPGAKMMMIGNPTRNHGFFYRSFTADRSLWECMTVSSLESGRVDPGFPAEIEADYGKDSNQYRVRVLGQFPLAEEGALIPLDLIERAARSPRTARGDLVAGLDVAGTGGDGSTLALRQGPVLHYIEQWKGLSQMALVGRVKAWYEELPQDQRPKAIYVDATGIGEGAASRLVEVGLPAEACKVGIRIKAPNKNEAVHWYSRYANVRSALIHRMAEWLEDDVSIPNDTDLIAELSSIKAGDPNSMGQETIEKKSLLKERLGRSPDKLDALSLTFAGGALGMKGGTKSSRLDALKRRMRA